MMSQCTGYKMDMTWFVIAFLRSYNILSTYAASTWSISKEIAQKVSEVFRPKYFIFFENIPVACNPSDISLYASGSARPQWLYDAKTKTFYAWDDGLHQSLPMGVHGGNFKNLPVLSLEIVNTEEIKVQYDLTDFLEEVTVYESNARDPLPSLEHVLAAWTTHSHILLDSHKFKARMIDVMANTIEEPITDRRPLDIALGLNKDVLPVKLEEPATAVSSKED